MTSKTENANPKAETKLTAAQERDNIRKAVQKDGRAIALKKAEFETVAKAAEAYTQRTKIEALLKQKESDLLNSTAAKIQSAVKKEQQSLVDRINAGLSLEALYQQCKRSKARDFGKKLAGLGISTSQDERLRKIARRAAMLPDYDENGTPWTMTSANRYLTTGTSLTEKEQLAAQPEIDVAKIGKRVARAEAAQAKAKAAKAPAVEGNVRDKLDAAWEALVDGIDANIGNPEVVALLHRIAATAGSMAMAHPKPKGAAQAPTVSAKPRAGRVVKANGASAAA